MAKITWRLVALLAAACLAASMARAQASSGPADGNHPWRQHAVFFYEIYPRSLAHRNHDGVGDSRGIASGLDYLKDL